MPMTCSTRRAPRAVRSRPGRARPAGSARTRRSCRSRRRRCRSARSARTAPRRGGSARRRREIRPSGRRTGAGGRRSSVTFPPLTVISDLDRSVAGRDGRAGDLRSRPDARSARPPWSASWRARRGAVAPPWAAAGGAEVVAPPSATTPAIGAGPCAPIDWSGVLNPNSSRTTTTVPTNAVAARRGITIIARSPRLVREPFGMDLPARHAEGRAAPLPSTASSRPGRRRRRRARARRARASRSRGRRADRAARRRPALADQVVDGDPSPPRQDLELVAEDDVLRPARER